MTDQLSEWSYRICNIIKRRERTIERYRKRGDSGRDREIGEREREKGEMEESREMVNTTDSRDKSREDIKLGSGAFRLITIRIAVQYK